MELAPRALYWAHDDRLQARIRRGAELSLPAILAGSVFSVVAIPRAAPIFAVVFFSALIAGGGRNRRSAWIDAGSPGLAIAAVAGAYLIWRAAAPQAAGSAICDATMLFALAALTYVATRAANELSGPLRIKLAQWAFRATFVAALYLVVEFLTAQALIRNALNSVSVLRGSSARHFVFAGSEVAEVRAYLLNRNVGALNLALWPALAGAAAVAARNNSSAVKVRVAAAAFLLIAGAATFLSQHQSSMAAFIVALTVFAVARWRLRAARGARRRRRRVGLRLPVRRAADQCALHAWLADR